MDNLRAHGCYISDYQDTYGAIFTRIMQVSEETQRDLLAEAIAGMNDDGFTCEPHFKHHSRLACMDGVSVQPWMKVSNKDFVCFNENRLDGENILALYRHDFKVNLVSANKERLHAFVKKQGCTKQLSNLLVGV